MKLDPERMALIRNKLTQIQIWARDLQGKLGTISEKTFVAHCEARKKELDLLIGWTKKQ